MSAEGDDPRDAEGYPRSSGARRSSAWRARRDDGKVAFLVVLDYHLALDALVDTGMPEPELDEPRKITVKRMSPRLAKILERALSR